MRDTDSWRLYDDMLATRLFHGKSNLLWHFARYDDRTGHYAMPNVYIVSYRLVRADGVVAATTTPATSVSSSTSATSNSASSVGAAHSCRWAVGPGEDGGSGTPAGEPLGAAAATCHSSFTERPAGAEWQTVCARRSYGAASRGHIDRPSVGGPGRFAVLAVDDEQQSLPAVPFKMRRVPTKDLWTAIAATATRPPHHVRSSGSNMTSPLHLRVQQEDHHIMAFNRHPALNGAFFKVKRSRLYGGLHIASIEAFAPRITAIAVIDGGTGHAKGDIVNLHRDDAQSGPQAKRAKRRKPEGVTVRVQAVPADGAATQLEVQSVRPSGYKVGDVLVADTMVGEWCRVMLDMPATTPWSHVQFRRCSTQGLTATVMAITAPSGRRRNEKVEGDAIAPADLCQEWLGRAAGSDRVRERILVCDCLACGRHAVTALTVTETYNVSLIRAGEVQLTIENAHHHLTAGCTWEDVNTMVWPASSLALRPHVHSCQTPAAAVAEQLRHQGTEREPLKQAIPRLKPWVAKLAAERALVNDAS